MEVFQAVRTVLAVREFQDKPVPPHAARRIVEAAHLSGSASNRQPWHFIAVVDRDTLRQLGAIARSGPYIAGAPFAVVAKATCNPLDQRLGSQLQAGEELTVRPRRTAARAI